MEIAKKDFLHNCIALLSLVMNKNVVTHLINISLNLHVLFYIFHRKMIHVFGLKTTFTKNSFLIFFLL